MKDGDEPARAEQRSAGSSDSGDHATRVEEAGEADEPDAPTAEAENVGMNTVLDAEPLTGVQDDQSEE